MSRTLRALAPLVLALGAVVPASAWIAAPASAQESARTEPLTIQGKSGSHRFAVEVMRNDADRSRGLMYRRSMAADHGMLFDFEQVEPVSMWMKNTYLSLDMLFIRADGTVARIAADTEPLSTAIIPSGEPVLAVLELNAGTAAKLGLRPGDRVEHPLFRRR
ncbi:DUF192 domain-containing protein [Methylobacterium dankookense]|uniref:DUF192 domain-containing protein n=1 Tax=Methylobacterium dankookense TaxID=560405 RepID=A0A564FX85_9HYPH|nr:hypothetical protein IFDJLNFL_0623 [Methylobacterium dankookense]VUF12612.1 hypothetical protein MTDSW087_02305 [Methylobacterium dankookense]